MDVSKTIAPKSDQLNADDLIAGPITIKITAVEPGSAEQPVIIRYEGDNGRPYKPGKSMRRVLVTIYGRTGDDYVGRQLVLYNDPTIKFGKDTTGGIRISHASDILEPVEVTLTVTRGRRAPFIVEPLVVQKPEAAFDITTLTDIGATKAREGLEVLSSWFTALPKDAKKALKSTLDAEWKPIAESVAKN